MTRRASPDPQASGATQRTRRALGRTLGLWWCLLAAGCDAEPGRPAPSASTPSRQTARLATAGAGATPTAREPGALASSPRARGGSAHGAAISVAPSSGAAAEPARPARPPRVSQRRILEPEPPQTSLPPGANDEFDAGALADVEYALVAENENAFATLVHEKKRVLPRNCRDWKIFRKRGYAPKSALGEHLDGGALVRCGSLEFFARAAPSRVSYVRDALIGAGPNTLPAIVASATSKPALQARTAAAARGLTLAELLPSAYTGSSELLGRVAIVEPSSETSVLLNAEVWGDINRDGIEDLAISVLNSSDDGSYLDVRLIELTRLSPEAPLTVLAVLR